MPRLNVGPKIWVEHDRIGRPIVSWPYGHKTLESDAVGALVATLDQAVRDTYHPQPRFVVTKADDR